MRFRRLATTTLLTAMTIVLTATPAMAHAELIASDPADGASLGTAPTQVRLTFNEPVTPAPDVVEIVGPDNTTWTVGTPAVAGEVITAPVQASGPAGAYTLTYRVVSSDGDPVTGSLRFTLTAPATTTPPPTTTTTTTTTTPPAEPTEATAAEGDGDDGVPVWVWIAGAVVLVGVGTAVALRAGRAKP